jgi:HKD family nuclease
MRRGRDINIIINADPTYMNRAMKFIIVHTIAHMIILGLWSYLGLSSDELSYVILPRDESYDVWVFEAASGGYGFLKYLAEHSEILYNIVSSALSNVLPRDQCIVSLDSNILRMLRNTISTTINSLKQASALSPQDTQRLDSIQKQLEVFLENIKFLYNVAHVTPHNYVVNRYLSRIIPGRLKEHFNKVIDKFVTTFSEFDGTINYYFIEEGCISEPFTQPFSVSCVIVKPIADGVSQMSLERPLRKPIIELIETARSSIDIITWVLSIDGLSDLIKALKKACSSGAKIRLLLGRGIFSDDNAYNSAINSLKKLFQELGNSIEVRLYDKGQLHAKMIIVDKVVVIQGSLNLTKAALTSNVETAQVIIDPEEVRRCAEEFDKLWNEAIAVKSPKGLKPRQ